MMIVWMVGCIAFVFAAVAECIIVKYIFWKKTQKKKEQQERKRLQEEYLRSIKVFMKPNEEVITSHFDVASHKPMRRVLLLCL